MGWSNSFVEQHVRRKTHRVATSHNIIELNKLSAMISFDVFEPYWLVEQFWCPKHQGPEPKLQLNVFRPKGHRYYTHCSPWGCKNLYIRRGRECEAEISSANQASCSEMGRIKNRDNKHVLFRFFFAESFSHLLAFPAALASDRLLIRQMKIMRISIKATYSENQRVESSRAAMRGKFDSTERRPRTHDPANAVSISSS